MKVPLLFVVFAASLAGADFGTYRGFRFGMDLPLAATQAEVPAPGAKRTFTRPSKLSWPAGSMMQYDMSAGDPAADFVLRFVNGELFQIVANFALVGTMTRLDQIAQNAIGEDRRLDILEAPQRAAARDKQEQDALRLPREAARRKNKTNFRP